MTTTFDDAAFAALPVAPDAVAALRERAFEEFRALPMPSPETEEWRYTDLSGFACSTSRRTRPGHGGGRARRTAATSPRRCSSTTRAS